MEVKIIVRDGRAGRAVDREGKGVILGKFERAQRSIRAMSLRWVMAPKSW